MKEILVKLKKITKLFKGIEIIKDFNLEIYSNEFISIVGANGSGKTTIIRVIAGLEREFKGEVEFYCTKDKDISFVFQNRSLLPWYTIKKNLKIKLLNTKLTNKEKEKLINTQLLELGILSFANYYPEELSGGTLQKVSLATALITKPKLLILDEPFSAIDCESKDEYYNLFLELKNKYQLAIVIVTHDPQEVLALSIERFIKI